jgi:hypothetical protein
MMTVGLHCRLTRPARAAAIAEFIDYAKSFGREVWICTREEIANHWYENHLPRGVGSPIKPNLSTGGMGSSSRFSFLPNLTTPRDAPEAATMPSLPVSSMSASDDGDII